MACYHFTLKLDRRPDKTPIHAATHLEYIHRVGKFRNIDFKRAVEVQELKDNMIGLNHAKNESSRNIPAASHAAYINRQEDYSAKGGCIYKGHHLPKWANDSARTFFEAADQYERANGTRYREIEFALPNELALEQQLEIVNTFIDHHLKDFYYAYAVHDKIGAMSNGERNTHVHIMFSERKLDTYEKMQERTPELFFKQASKKRPELGGCPKDAKWNGRNRMEYLCQMREDFAKIQNAVLEKYGIEARVDHRSLKEQYMEAVKKNHLQLARALDRLPEPHIGPITAANKKSQKVTDLLAYRAYKLERSQLILAANKLENEMEEAIHKQDGESIQTALSKMEDSEKASLASVSGMKRQLMEHIQEIAALNSIVIWQTQAEQMAREKFMTWEERKEYRDYLQKLRDKAQLEDLRKNLQEPAENASEEIIRNYKNIMSAMNHDLQELSASVTELSPKIHVIDQRLSQPPIRLLLQKEADRIMQADRPQKQRLKKLQTEVQTLLPRLQEAVFSAIELDAMRIIKESGEKTHFTAKEIDAYLKQCYIVQAKDYKALQRKSNQLAKGAISLERATEIAKNVYLKGAFKSLRAEKRTLEKEHRILTKLRQNFEQAESSFQALPKPKWYQDGSSYREQEQKLSLLRQELLARESSYLEQSASLQAREKEYIEKCNSTAGQKKIASITKGILRKNKPALDQYLLAHKKAAEAYGKMRKTQELQKAIRRQIALDGTKGISYQCPPPSGVSESKSARLPSGEKRIFDIAQAIQDRQKGVGSASVVIRLDAEEEELDFESLDQTDREAEMEKSERLLR